MILFLFDGAVATKSVEPITAIWLIFKAAAACISPESFVMNSEQEIHDTMVDFQQSEFGGWPWPSRENVHPHAKSRFAKYADGSEEIKK